MVFLMISSASEILHQKNLLRDWADKWIELKVYGSQPRYLIKQ